MRNITISQAAKDRAAANREAAAARRALEFLLQEELDTNNVSYRIGTISRDQWIARNRELANEAHPLGLTLPPVSLGL